MAPGDRLARSLPVRKLDDEGRAAVGARLAAEPPLMLLDDAVGHPEAEPGALAGWFGREERVEDPGEQLRRNAGPGVSHLDPDAPFRLRGPERQHARPGMLRHRLVRVLDEVQEHLSDLVLVGVHGRDRSVPGYARD